MQLPEAYFKQASQLCVDNGEPDSSASPCTEDPATDADVCTCGKRLAAAAACMSLSVCPLNLAT